MTDLDVRAESTILRDAGPVRQAAATSLTWGFRFSVATLVVGLLVTLLRGDDIETEATDFSHLAPHLLDGDGSAIVSLAILIMLLTPVATVLVTAIGFYQLPDRRFGKISLVVLAVLAVTLTVSLLR